MERHDRLQKNYEDALFALLMDQVAQEEGERLLAENERLMNDPGAEVPESFDRASRAAIRRAAAGGRRRRTTLRNVRRILDKVAILVLMILVLVGSAYAAFPSVRIRMLNWMIENSDVASRLTVLEDPDAEAFLEGDTLMGYQLPALPRGYVVVERKDGERSGWVKYQHENGSSIQVGIENSRTAYLDTEDADFAQKVTIHGFSGTLAEKEDSVTITWNDTEHEKVIMLVCIMIDKQHALDYTNEITFVGN